MKLYWRIKRNGKWTWRAVTRAEKEKMLEDIQVTWLTEKMEEE